MSVFTTRRRSSSRINKGTPQQETIWRQLGEQSVNDVMIEALAGCGKSSTCREAMHRIIEIDDQHSVKYAVFNKANADEFRADCPFGVEVATMHRFGLDAIKTEFPKIKVEAAKNYQVMDSLGCKLSRSLRRAVNQLVGHCKGQMLDDANPEFVARVRELAAMYGIELWHRDYDVCEWVGKLLQKAKTPSGAIDFDDMVWLPVVLNIPFGPTDTLFVDEAQDLNLCQHELIKRISNDGRLVAVGDRYQAIYAWRGADSESMSRMASWMCSMVSLPLTVTFRCPKAHVDLARRYVPSFEAHESNREGAVRSIDVSEARPIAGDMYIAPTNRHAIKAALRRLTAKIPVVVKGRSIGDSLVSVLYLVGNQSSCTALSKAISRWRDSEVGRLLDQDGKEDQIEDICDRAEGLQAIVGICDSPTDVELMIGRLFSEEAKSNAAVFSTIHRAKGLEAGRVFFHSSGFRKPKKAWEEQQQKNLKYVALTRSKNELFLVTDPEDKEIKEEGEFA